MASVAVAVAVTLAACGGDGNGGGPEPVLSGPASRFAAALGEIEGSYRVNPPETYGLSTETFSAVGPFASQEERETLPGEWSYESGYHVLYEPDGLLAGVLEGRYYVTIETHLFETTEGAREAYGAYTEQSEQAGGSERQDLENAPGNQASAWKLVQGTVGASEVPGVYHRVIMRRGNLVAVVQTFGGEPYMSIEPARAIAAIIDERALGERDAVEPTPIPDPLPTLTN